MNKFVVVSFSLNAGVVVYGTFHSREVGEEFAIKQFGYKGWTHTHSWSVEQIFTPDEDEE